MKKAMSIVLSAAVLLLSFAFILPVTAHAEESHSYSFYYAPSDAQIAAGYSYGIWIKNPENPGGQTGNMCGKVECLSSDNRAVYGCRSSFSFTTTAELWVTVYDSGKNEVARVPLTDVNLENLNNKVIYPNGSLHDLDTFTYTFAYAPSDNELGKDAEYYAAIVNSVQDNELIETKLTTPDSIRYYAYTDETKTERRPAAVGTITTNLKMTSSLQIFRKMEGSDRYATVALTDYTDYITLADYDGQVIFPDKSLHKLEKLEYPEEDPDEGIDLKIETPEKPELDPVSAADYEKGEGYIQVVESTGEEDSDFTDVEIVNLFHSTETTAYKGISYDLKTNTLILDNVKGGSFELQADKMNALKIKVVGSCTIRSLNLWDAYPVFTGTGTLNVTEALDVYETEEPFRAGVTPVTVKDGVTVTLNRSSERPPARIHVTSYEDSIDPASLISYGSASEAPKWNLEKSGGITDVEAQYYGIRMRSVFQAKELLKRKDGSDTRYYVKSICHSGTEPLSYHHVYPLVEKDGIWYEDTWSVNLWDQDHLFRSLTDEELAALPTTLANGDGTVTAYLSTTREFGKGYTKDNKVFVMSYEGMIRNLIVDPSYPLISLYQRDTAPFVLMRALKEFKDGYNDITLVRMEKEFKLKNSGDSELREAMLSENGYQPFTRKVFYPYEYDFMLSNNKITFTGTSHVHSMTAVAAKAATCGKAGSKAYYYCKACGKYFKDQAGTKETTVAAEKIAATGKHTSDGGTVTTKATYTKAGVKTYKCKVCGKVIKTEAIPKLAKKKNTIKAVGKKVTVKYKKLKKKNQTIAVKNAMTITKAQGKLTYKKTSGDKKITVNAKTGSITLKKGLKKKTWTVKINVTAAGTTSFKAGTVPVTVKITVK